MPISPCRLFSASLVGIGLAFCSSVTWAQANPPVPNPPIPNPPATNSPVPAAAQPAAAQAANGVPVPDEPQKVEVVRENYPNGQVRIEKSIYRDAAGAAISHGPFMMYGPDASKIGGGNFQHGKRQGHWARTFRPQDAILFQDGPLARHTGPFTSEADFVNGEITGVWTIKTASGALASSWGFLGGKQHGDWIWNSPAGTPDFRAQYLGGKQHGTAEFYDPNGKVVESKTYIDGRELVQQSFRYPNGVVACEGTFLTAKEKLQTNYDWWQGQAQTLFYGYVGGRDKHGKFVWYYPSGRKKIEGEFLLGQITGTWIYYGEDGTVTKSETVPPPDLPKDQAPAPQTGGVAAPAGNTPPVGNTNPGTAPAPTPASTNGPVPGNPGITAQVKPAPGDRPVDKETTVEPGVAKTTPEAPTIAAVTEVKAERVARALSATDETSSKPNTPAKRSPIELKDEK